MIHEKISNLKFVHDANRTGKLWIQFMDFVLIIRMFIRAERTGNWKLHLHATEQMLPFFAAAGHNKYLKAVLLYLQDAKELCDCLKRKYEKGLFTIWRKDKLFWSGTFTDQVIEQDLMLSGKSEGGLINITHKEAARTKWLLSAHVVANYSEALRDLTGVKTGTWSEQHRDMRLSQRKEGYKHLRNFIDFLEIHNPFRAPSTELINIATGVIASSDVNVDTSIDIGKDILRKIGNKCLSEISLKKKDQARTFAIMRKSVKVDGKEIRLSSEQLSQRLLASAARDMCPMDDVFTYELSAVSPALFLDNGMMRKNNKAELMNALLTPGKVENYEPASYHVIDGCALFYRIPWPKIGKVSDLYKLFLDSLFLVQDSGLTIVFDDYSTENTKAPEQKRRKSNSAAAHFDLKMNTLIPTDRKKFLSCKENKQTLIDLFSFYLVRDGVTVKHALDDGDADTLIVREALNRAKETNVVVHSIDTDIFIALVHHFDKTEKDIIMTTKQGLCSIGKVVSSLEDDLRECLLFSHAISGCDTVSATFGMGKLKAFNKLKDSSYWRNEMKIISDDDIEIDDMVALGERFYIQMYGKVAAKAKSLDQVREILYSLPKYIPITRMPPTSRAFYFHMLRAYLQINTWKHLRQLLDLEKFGFAKDENGNVTAIITDKENAPKYLLQEMKCSCQKPNRAGLLCTGCSCTKYGLPCTPLCKCGGECSHNDC